MTFPPPTEYVYPTPPLGSLPPPHCRSSVRTGSLSLQILLRLLRGGELTECEESCFTRGSVECDAVRRPTERATLVGIRVAVRLPILGTNGAGVGEDRLAFDGVLDCFLENALSFRNNPGVIGDRNCSDSITASEVSLSVSERGLVFSDGIFFCGGSTQIIGEVGLPQAGETEREDDPPPSGLALRRDGSPRGCCEKEVPLGRGASFAQS